MEEKIKKLKEKLEKIGTRHLLRMIGIHFITFANDAKDVAEQSDIFNKTKLMSPQKQYTYLAGLLMSTDDKSKCAITKDESMSLDESMKLYEELESDVQEITSEYVKNFLDTDIKSNVEVIKRNLVSMEAFTSYFDTGILRYPEQTVKLIRILYSPFDTELKDMMGLEIEDYISFYQLVSDSFEKSMTSSKHAVDNIIDFLNSFNPDAVDVEKEFHRLMELDQGRAGTELQTAMDSLSTLKVSDVIQQFGDKKGNKLLEIFGLYRASREFSYYNEKNPFAAQPLCWIDAGETLFIVHPNFVLNAIYDHITDILENPQNRFADKYKRIKAETVENQFLLLLKKIFGDNAIYHTNVCEERGTKEHDILIEFNDYILIAEAKASKVREPFFNPEKAYKRVSDHFNSDIGIGGAYEQAIILKKSIEEKETAILYEKKTTKFEIKNISKKKILPLVLTLNQFGGLAVNTSFLLKKEEGQPYPWVCNWHDFDNIIEILQYLNKTPEDFVNYLAWRIDNHVNVLSSDELDVIEGYFLDPELKNRIKSSPAFFPPNGPKLIDKIYFESHGIEYEYPAMNHTTMIKKKKIGRNELCPCGSGKKFKKCCIGKGIFD